MGSHLPPPWAHTFLHHGFTHSSTMGSHLPPPWAHTFLHHGLTPSSTMGSHIPPPTWRTLPSLAFSMRSSQGYLRSSRMICLEASEISTMSGLSVVAAPFSGNFSCFLRSTFSSQSCATASWQEEVALAAGVGFCPALTKVMVFFTGRRHVQIVSAMAFRTWSWR